LHILIIRPGAIGDTLLTFPIIKAIRKEYGDPHITLVGNPAVLPLALASDLVDAVSDYGQLQWSSLFSEHDTLSPAMRSQLKHTNLAICWLRDPDGLVEQNLRLAGVQRVIIASGRPPEGTQIHVAVYLAETIGLQHVEMPFTLSLKHAEPSTGESDKWRIAIHPGSGGVQKCWPAPFFAALIEQLWQRDYPVLLLAGPADHLRFKDILSLISPPSAPSRPDMFATLIDAPLLRVAQHLQQCRGYIGNDSGITHLSAMLGAPTVALFGPTDPAIWRPVGPDVTILQENQLENLSVQTVLNSILSYVL
jgi:heptosyltransferase III